jgi:hypothetical protein
MFTCLSFAAFVIKHRQVMILICMYCFVTLFNKNVLLSTTLDHPVILDGKISSLFIIYIIIISIIVTIHIPEKGR